MFDRAAQGDDAHVIRILKPKPKRGFRRHFDEQFRLQFREMREETAHPAGGVMFG